jgi:prolyl-tRNA synthetase
MPDGKVLQLPSTHFLGQNFSKAFNIRFTDKDKKEKYVWRTCYGHATWRVLGALIAIHGDDKGLVIPPSISPYQAVIIPIYYTEKEKEKIFNKIKTLKKKLKIRCYADLREEHTPGWKFNYWELKGVPVRIEIGPKDLKKKQIILFRRDLRKREVVKEKDLKKRIEFLLKDIQDNLRKKADSFFSQNLSEARSFSELKKILAKRGGLVKIEWCGSLECANEIKARTNGGTIRGTIFGKEEKAKGKCIFCEKEAKEVVYIAKQY